MPRLLALLVSLLLIGGGAVPVAADAASKSKSKSSSSSASKSKKKKKSSAEDCDMEDWASGDDDCDDYELVDGQLQKKSSCGGVGMVPFALGGGVAGRLAFRRRRRR